MDEPMLTSADLCQRYGINRSTLTRWVRSGRVVPVFKFPGRHGGYLFPADLPMTRPPRKRASA